MPQADLISSWNPRSVRLPWLRMTCWKRRASVVVSIPGLRGSQVSRRRVACGSRAMEERAVRHRPRKEKNLTHPSTRGLHRRAAPWRARVNGSGILVRLWINERENFVPIPLCFEHLGVLAASVSMAQRRIYRVLLFATSRYLIFVRFVGLFLEHDHRS